MTATYTMGLDLGGTLLKAGLVDRSGRLVHFTSRPSRANEGPDAVLAAVASAGSVLAERAQGGVAAAGIGIPGVIHPETGRAVGSTPHLHGWAEIATRERVSATLGLPVVVDNDANLAAWGEAKLGAAKNARLALVITIGTGVGCGIVHEGRLLRGAWGGAGEIGHLPIGSGEHACRCGVPNCVEPEISASGLVHATRLLGDEDSDAEAVFAAAANGDPEARERVGALAEQLGRTIAVAVNLLNPDFVVIGGGLARSGELLLQPLKASLERHVLESHWRHLRVVPSALGERAGVVGAGLRAWEAVGAPAVPAN